jgi:hypothetical protein
MDKGVGKNQKVSSGAFKTEIRAKMVGQRALALSSLFSVLLIIGFW